jgi:dTDP-4-dehydrorhamnose reductase
MLGQDLMAQFSTHHEVTPLPRSAVDITDPARVMRAIDDSRPDVVVHAAAFTGVDECELQPAVAFQVNTEGTSHVALACRRLRIPMLYISTDYVFDGEKPDPYAESDAPNPINVYGKSKLEGERIVAEVVERFWVVRVSWLFGPLGRNFVKVIQSQAEAGRPLRVVSDQIGAPTYTMDLADKLEEVVTRADPGVYHITNQGWCSWFEFAQEILAQAGLAKVPIAAIPTSALDRPARRPRNSRLANVRLEASNLGLLPPWQDALHRYFLREGTF